MKIIGIDDAGRGPVIGPMVLAGILIEEEENEILKKWGAKDSKQLLPKKRKEIGDKIKEKFSYFAELAFPDEIDSRTADGTNLNWIEAIKSARIVNKLARGINEKIRVIVDCPSPNCEAWGNYLKKYLDEPNKIELICEHKADENYPSVSGASIIAKETREDEVKKIKEEFGIEFGSGYCHDPLTKEFLKGDIKIYEEKGIIRKSWDTWMKVVAEKEQKKLF